MKLKFLVLALVIGIFFGLATINVYAHKNYADDKVKYDVKKIENGIQYVITSENADIVKELQEDAARADKDGSGGYCDNIQRGGHMMNWGGRNSGYHYR